MNLDIIEAKQGFDLGMAASAVGKAANVLATQLGSLEYAPDFGVDLRFFLDSQFQFQKESFRAYLIERLSHHQVDVTSVLPTVEALFEKYTFYVDEPNSNQKGLIR